MTAQPRFLTPVTPSRRSSVTAVDKVARALNGGAELMPLQRHIAQLQTERLRDGSWAYQTLIVSGPRQIGKTFLRGPVHIHRCLSRQFQNTWFTAQTRGHARDIVVNQIGPRFNLSPLSTLGRLRQSQGSEGIYFLNTTGSMFRVFAPAEGGLDSTANHLVDVDEGWKFDAATGAALDNSVSPTMLTTEGQFAMVSTAGTSKSVWLRGYITMGRDAVTRGEDTGVALVEYGLTEEQAGDVRQLLEGGTHGDRFDRAVMILAECNPAHGYTLKVPALAAGVRRMMALETAEGGIDGVLRAYGNHWTRASLTIIPEEVVAATTTSDFPHAVKAPALAVAAGIGRDDAVLVAAWRDRTGRPYVNVLRHRPGIRWAAAALAGAARIPGAWSAVTCVGDGPVLEVVETAQTMHSCPEVDRVAGLDYSTACAQLLTLFLELIIRHDGHPALVSAIEDADTRRIRDGGWVWSRVGSSGSVAALEAATVALWAYDHAPEPVEPGIRWL